MKHEMENETGKEVESEKKLGIWKKSKNSQYCGNNFDSEICFWEWYNNLY